MLWQDANERSQESGVRRNPIDKSRGFNQDASLLYVLGVLRDKSIFSTE